VRRVQQTQKGVPTSAASSSVRRARALGASSRTTWLTQSVSSFKRLVDSRYAFALAAASSNTGLSLKSAPSASSIALVGELKGGVATAGSTSAASGFSSATSPAVLGAVLGAPLPSRRLLKLPASRTSRGSKTSTGAASQVDVGELAITYEVEDSSGGTRVCSLDVVSDQFRPSYFNERGV